MSMIQITIIVPIYNVGAYLRRCLDSLVAQSYPHLQMLLIDDASSDESLAIARGYAQKDRRIEVIEQRANGGQGLARNVGLQAARGEYVWFVDADDELSHPQVVQLLALQLLQHRPEILIFETIKLGENIASVLLNGYVQRQVQQLNANNQALKAAYHHFMRHGLKQEASFFGMVWDKVYARSFLKEQHFSFLPQRLYEDEHSLLLIEQATKVYFWDQVGYRYWLRANSSANSPMDEHFLRHSCASATIMLERAQKSDPQAQVSAACYALGVYLHRLERYRRRQGGLTKAQSLSVYDQLAQLVSHDASKELLTNPMHTQRLSLNQLRSLAQWQQRGTKTISQTGKIKAVKQVMRHLVWARYVRIAQALLTLPLRIKNQ